MKMAFFGRNGRLTLFIYSIVRLFEFKEDFHEILNEFYDTKNSKKQLNEMAQTAIFDIPRFFI